MYVFFFHQKDTSLRLLFSYRDKKWVGLLQFVYNRYNFLGIVNANHYPYYCYNYIDCYVLLFGLKFYIICTSFLINAPILICSFSLTFFRQCHRLLLYYWHSKEINYYHYYHYYYYYLLYHNPGILS